MRALTSWTRLRRRLEPLAVVLDGATPWRVSPPLTVQDWLHRLTWYELLECDCACRSLCREPPALPLFPLSLTVAASGSDGNDEQQERIARQVMHRMLFAIDLCRRLPDGYRREHPLTGDYSHDAERVLIFAWRSGASSYWAQHFGKNYRNL